MVIVATPAALKVRQLNLAFNDVSKDVWNGEFGAAESGHKSTSIGLDSSQ
jgi:hypothetical protein